ncbi:hypothetical protein OH77DRAFT_1438738 [Trametes cingulata]|nr:hypothetical protein OH77DRAFT_1438738 [Trametes cingulata]
MDSTTVHLPATTINSLIAIASPMPQKSAQHITESLEMTTDEYVEGPGYGNPSYWRVGGAKVQELLAYHRELRWEFEWSEYQAALFHNPQSTEACPWPPFKEPPAFYLEWNEVRVAAVDGEEVASAPPSSDLNGAPVLSPHQGASPTGENEGSWDVDASGSERETPEAWSPASDTISTPPGLAVDEETRLGRILDMFLRRGEWADIPEESNSPRDAEGAEDEGARALGDLMRYLELG